MSTPNAHTPTSDLILIARDASPWYGRNKMVLDRVFSGFEGFGERVLAAGKRLDDAQRVFDSEQRDDVGLTDQRLTLVTDTRTLVRAARHAAEITFSKRGDVKKIMRDFGSSRPSQEIRSMRDVHAALRRVNNALEVHGEAIRQRVLVFDAIKQRAIELQGRFDSLHEAQSREVIETRDARHEREEARAHLIAMLREAYDAAQIAAITDGDAALKDLIFIFAQHVRRSRRSSVGASSETSNSELDADMDSFDDDVD